MPAVRVRFGVTKWAQFPSRESWRQPELARDREDNPSFCSRLMKPVLVVRPVMLVVVPPITLMALRDRGTERRVANNVA